MAADVHQLSLGSARRMRAVAAVAAVLLLAQAVQMLLLAAQVARVEVAQEVRQVAARLQQEQQVRPTQVPVAEVAVIAMIQTHQPQVALAVRESSLCATSCQLFLSPILQLPPIAAHLRQTTSRQVSH